MGVGGNMFVCDRFCGESEWFFIRKLMVSYGVVDFVYSYNWFGYWWFLWISCLILDEENMGIFGVK